MCMVHNESFTYSQEMTQTSLPLALSSAWVSFKPSQKSQASRVYTKEWGWWARMWGERVVELHYSLTTTPTFQFTKATSDISHSLQNTWASSLILSHHLCTLFTQHTRVQDTYAVWPRMHYASQVEVKVNAVCIGRTEGQVNVCPAVWTSGHLLASVP